MPCCGRPNNRAQKGGTQAEYLARYAYLSSHQRAQQVELGASKCESCDALTMGDPCGTCGAKKTQPQAEATKEG
jgi:hypothetical protein